MKTFYEHQSPHQSAEVRSIGNPALLCATAEHSQSTDQLKYKPETDGDESRHLSYEIRQQDSHAARGEQENVTTEHDRDGARCTQARNQQAGFVAAGKGNG